MIDQGNINGSTNGLIGNNTINESFSSANPASGNGSGSGTVTLTNLGDSGNFRIYDSVVTLPVTIADTFLAGSTNVNLTGSGTLKFTGRTQVPINQTVADTLWTGAVNQDWKNPFNWSNRVPQESAPQWSAFINTASGNFPSITLPGNYQGDWDIVVGGGTNGRLDQSAGTVSTGNGNWFFLGWQGAQGTYNQSGSGSLRVGGLTDPNGNMLIGLDNGTVATCNVNTTGTAQAGGIFAGCNGAATGVINMTAGAVNVAGEMQVGGSFFGNGGVGQLNMNGGSITANIVSFARGGNNLAAISGSGVITGGNLSSRQWFTLGFAGNSSNNASVRPWFTLPVVGSFALHFALLSPPGIDFFLEAGFTFVSVQMVVATERSHAEARKIAMRLEIANSELAAYALQAEELAVTRERSRMAREIHDLIGHYLTVIRVQLEAALRIQESQPAKALDAVRNARECAGEGLREIRNSVESLRSGPLENRSLCEALLVLVTESERAGQLVNLVVKGSERPLGRATALTIYRASQEALTNARKHAPEARVTLELQFDRRGEVVLRASDDGPGNLACSSSGFGLTGLQERAALVGGSLVLDRTAGSGFSFVLTIPS